MTHRFQTLALFALLLIGCARSAPPASRPVGLVTSFGEFPSPAGDLVLKVERTEVALVVGTLLRPARTVIFSETIGSDTMRWCFYWCPNGTLWAFSSDTGYLKQIQPDGSARSVSTGERLPEAVFGFVPSFLRKMYLK